MPFSSLSLRHPTLRTRLFPEEDKNKKKESEKETAITTSQHEVMSYCFTPRLELSGYLFTAISVTRTFSVCVCVCFCLYRFLSCCLFFLFPSQYLCRYFLLRAPAYPAFRAPSGRPPLPSPLPPSRRSRHSRKAEGRAPFQQSREYSFK